MTLNRRHLLMLSFATVAGCGGGGTSGPTGILFTLDWPQTRTLPLAAQSLRLRIRREGTLLTEKLYLPGPVVEERLTGLPDFIALTLEADAFGTSDATGDPLASTSLPLRLARGRIDRVTLTLTSAISTVQLDTTFTESLWSLMASGRSATSASVLTAPGQWEWSVSSASLGTLTPSGASATFTPTGFGEATLTAREKESGKSASLVRPVTVGEPTSTVPSVATRPLSAPLTALTAVGTRFLTLTPGTLNALQTNGATAWEVHPPSSLTHFHQLLLDRALLSDGNTLFASYTADTGSRFWQRDFGTKPTTPIVYDNTGTFLYNTETPLLQARGLFDGLVVWSAALVGTPLYGDSSRFVLLDPATRLVFALNRNAGTGLWQLLFSADPLYLGATTGNNPLLFFTVAGELRAILAQSGAKLWGVGLSAVELTLSSDQASLFARTDTQLYALSPQTGATLWSRADVATLLGKNAGGELLVRPASHDRVQAIRATDGALLWTQFLPAGTNTVRLVGNTVAVHSTSRGQLYGLSATTGAYLWRIPLTDPSPKLAGIGSVLAVADSNQLRIVS